MLHGKVYIYGKHVLTEALEHTPRAIEEIFLAQKFDDENLRALARKFGVKISVLNGNKMPKEIDPSAVHQGAAGLLALDRLERPYGEFIKNFKAEADTAFVLLGEIADPQNVGAIIRSAAAFGLSGVLIPEHNQARITGSIVKVSAGMVFRIPLISIANINSTVRDLKDKGFFVYGLDGAAKKILSKETFDAPTLFIIGNEGKGIRLKTAELCDAMLAVPMNPRCESLNAASSATVAFYAWSAKHSKALL